ncbi:hypothetical protein HU200_039339 [Digitaria exilis]|uniref:RNase H type-1 domain-containing protein n=1 Tax=Digitaria exilis TaxID=1010633 RepID=A0A835BJ08_9POAL|nr:hypothetical protein HU200_039339 [Digitaria exilis]
MDVDTLCPMCRQLDEDGGHLFFKCKAVKHVWRLLELEQLRCTLISLGTGADVAAWRLPDIDVLKINFDGAFIKETRKGAWGFIIRDHHGTGVAAGTGALINLYDALHAEVHACLEVLRQASAMGISRIVLETDSLNLQTALTSEAFDRSPGGWLFREARHLLLLGFDVQTICHCHRLCNGVAHELAHSSVSRDPDEPIVWLDPLPSFVQELLIRHDAGSMI